MYDENKLICKKSGKITFRDKKDVITFINAHHYELRYYPCPYCKHWHTSKIKDKSEDIEFRKFEFNKKLKYKRKFKKYLK